MGHTNFFFNWVEPTVIKSVKSDSFCTIGLVGQPCGQKIFSTFFPFSSNLIKMN